MSEVPTVVPRSLLKWCSRPDVNISQDLIDRLVEQDVRAPEDLIYLPEGILLQLAEGIKIGCVGRFLTAVRKLRMSNEAGNTQMVCTDSDGIGSDDTPGSTQMVRTGSGALHSIDSLAPIESNGMHSDEADVTQPTPANQRELNQTKPNPSTVSTHDSKSVRDALMASGHKIFDKTRGALLHTGWAVAMAQILKADTKHCSAENADQWSALIGKFCPIQKFDVTDQTPCEWMRKLQEAVEEKAQQIRDKQPGKQAKWETLFLQLDPSGKKRSRDCGNGPQKKPRVSEAKMKVAPTADEVQILQCHQGPKAEDLWIVKTEPEGNFAEAAVADEISHASAAAAVVDQVRMETEMEAEAAQQKRDEARDAALSDEERGMSILFDTDRDFMSKIIGEEWLNDAEAKRTMYKFLMMKRVMIKQYKDPAQFYFNAILESLAKAESDLSILVPRSLEELSMAVGIGLPEPFRPYAKLGPLDRKLALVTVD